MTRRIKNHLIAKKRRSATAAAGKNIVTPGAAAIRENSKLAIVISLLHRKGGATIEQMMRATGWQSHSVRGAMSGALKKKRGLAITSVKNDGVRNYHISV